jgi:hypothetical protein
MDFTQSLQTEATLRHAGPLVMSFKHARPCRDPHLVIELHDHHHNWNIADGAGTVPCPPPCMGLRILVGAEGDTTRAHLYTQAVHRLDEPAARQGYDPLRSRIAVPVADPVDRQRSEQHGRIRRE